MSLCLHFPRQIHSEYGWYWGRIGKSEKENNWPKEKKKKKNNNNDKLKASVIEHGQKHESTLDVHLTDEENCSIWPDSKLILNCFLQVCNMGNVDNFSFLYI